MKCRLNPPTVRQSSGPGLTLGDGVEVGLLAHGSQQRQGADVDPHLGVAALLPGVVLHHVEQPAHQVEHAVLGVILHTEGTEEEAVMSNLSSKLGCPNRGFSIFVWD